jgi:diguanylate cyclase (GGDEF)-like protein
MADTKWVDRSDEMNFRAQTGGSLPYGYLHNVPTYYWQEPTRIARYYHAINTLPPGANVPGWVDKQGIDLAYNYFKARNNDKPWYTWDRLPDDDPANDLLKQIGMPPPEAMPLPERQKYYNPAFSKTVSNQDGYYPVSKAEAGKFLDAPSMAALPQQGDQVLVPSAYVDRYGRMSGLQPIEYGPGGLPKEQYDALQPWQKAVISASPWLNTAVGVVGGAVGGAFIGGPWGAAAGAVLGGAGAYLAEQGTDPETGQPKPGPAGDVARAMGLLNVPFTKAEQGVGVLGQLASSIQDPERYGPVQEVLGNLGAAFEAGKVTYPVAFADVTGKQITPMSMIGQAAGETWTVPEGAFAGSLALTEARRRIAAGESSTQVLDEIRARFGIAGTARETLAGFFLDPLNLLGDVANGVGYPLAKLAKNAPLAESFRMRSQLASLPEQWQRGLAGKPLLDTGNMLSNDIVDSLRIYGMKLRQMPVEEAVQYGAMSRWIAGLDKSGRLTELTPGTKAGFFDRLRGLTPQARAHEVLSQGVDGLQTLLAQEPDEALIYAHLQQIAGVRPAQAVEALENNPLPKWFSSAEGQGVSVAMKDILPKTTELHDRWITTRPQATILQRVAEMMDQDVYKLMADLHNAEPKDADTIYRAFLQSLEERAKANDKTATRLLETIRKDQSLTKLDGRKLKDYTELFMGKDGAPFDIGMYKGQLFHMLTDGLEKWAVNSFGVKPAGWGYRTADLVKRAQGKVLLGLNPLFLLNNGLNNLVTLGWDGLLEFTPARSRMRFLRELGVKPVRLRAGATAAEIGEDLLQAADLGGYELGSQIRRAGRAGDILQGMDDIIRRADKFPDFATLSQKVERWSSEMATVNAMRRYWDQVWTEGKAITRMTPDLEAALEAVDPGLSKKVARAIERGKTKAEIEKIVFRDLGKPSLKDVLTRQEKDLFSHIPGLIDELDDALLKSKTDEDIRAAFADARTKGQANVQAQVARNMQRMTVEAAEKVKIEGGQGLLDLFDNQMLDRHDFWLWHLTEMDGLAEDASAHSGPARQAIWQQGLDRADRNWDTLGNIEGSKWLGAVEALSGDKATPEYVNSLNNLTDQRANWTNFYQTRRRLMNEFFDQAAGLEDRAARSELWAQTNVKLNQEYVNALLIEDEMQAQLDQIFVNLYVRQFPDNPNAAADATRWRASIQDVRRRMAATMVLLRTGGQVPPELEVWLRMIPANIQSAVMDLTHGVPPYAMGKDARQATMKAFMDGIYGPYIREMLDASNGNAPLRPMPGPVGPQPTMPPAAPPEAPIAAAAVSELSPNRQEVVSQPPVESPVGEPAEPTTAITPETTPQSIVQETARAADEDNRANLGGVYRLAAEYGIGSSDAGGRKHILNILKQLYKVDDISQVTPEMAEQAFVRRELFKGAVDLEAQQVLDRRILEWRAQQIRENQRRMELAAPKAFTRDALFREAEAQLGTEQADAIMLIEDAKAKYWAGLEQGRTEEQWYEQQYWTHGGSEGGAGLAQLSPEEGIEYRVNRARTELESAMMDAGVASEDIDDTIIRFSNVQEKSPARDAENEPFWNELYEFYNAMRAKNYVTITGHAYDYQYVRELQDLNQRGLFQVGGGPEIVKAQTVFPETGAINDRAWLLPDGKILDVHDLEHDAQGKLNITRMKEQGAIRVRYTKGDAQTNETLLLEFSGRPSRQQIHTLEPYMNGDVIMDYGKGRNWLAPLHGFEETMSELDRVSGLSQAEKGVTRFLDNGKAWMHVFESGDVTTFIHEGAHNWLPMMPQKDVDIVSAWLKAEYNLDLPQGWQYGHENFVQAKEYFARGFERYLAEGRAPIPSLRRVFESFKKWMISIYQTLTGSQIDVKINDNIIELFDRWMGSVPEKPVAQMKPEEMAFELLHDELTGMKNRRAYQEATHLPIQVVMDVEGLKFVNDNYGHDAGDLVINALAKTINNTTDEGYRGSNRGDEFIMQFGSREEAEAAIQQIEQGLSNAIIPFNGEPYKGLGISAGIGNTLQEADLALNKNKAAAIAEGRRANRGEKPVQLAPAVTPEAPRSPYKVLINEVGADGLTAAERASLATPAPEVPVPAIEKLPSETRVMNVDIRRNAEHGGIEIQFSEKPSDSTIYSLKKAGYRWSSRQKVWYKKEKPGDWDRLGWLRTAPIEARTVIEPERWPTWETYHQMHKNSLQSDYFALIKQAIRNEELGYEDGVTLIGDAGAKAAMFSRYADRAETFTQAQFLNAVEPYYNRHLYTQEELIKFHYDTVANLMAAGKQIPNEILRDYPDLYISKAEPEIPPTNIYDGAEPKLFNAPKDQLSLFGEETAGFGLEAQKAPAETFNPPASQQPGLFGLGEFTEMPKKPAVPEAEGPAGPLFDAGEEARKNFLQAADAETEKFYSKSKPTAPSPETTVPVRVDDFRLAVRQMLLDELTKHPGWPRSIMKDAFEVNEVPGFGKMSFHDAIERFGGVEQMKPFLDEIWDLTHKPQPPIDIPITIQPGGIDNFIAAIADHYRGGDLSSRSSVIWSQRDFENEAQRLMGLDLNDEKNLNLAYDALEGAFNQLAREVRADLDKRNAPLAERLQALASLENKLLRARRTIAKAQLQQFSTPLSISEAAGFAADVRPGDVISEPTAGTANLVDRFHGRDDVTVKVNEIDEGRLQVLRALGYDPTDINVQSAAWVVGPDGKRLPPIASTAIINPPWGAYSTGKYGTAVNVPVKMNDWSQRFTYLIMQRMSDDSRLSGVMPTNWVYTMDRASREITPHRSEFLRWLDEAYWVRAVIESPPDAYRQRGTDIGSLLVVVDKSFKPEGALPAIEAWGENAPKTWDEYAALVEQLGKGGTHERRNVEQSQSIVRGLVDDEINARRPASGPDATGLVDPNARVGRPEPAPTRIGRPIPAGTTVEPGPAARPAQPGTGPSGETGLPAVGGGYEPGQRPGGPNVAAAPTGGERPVDTAMVEGQPAGVPGAVQPELGASLTTGRPGVTEPELQPQNEERLSPAGEPTGRYIESAQDLEHRRAATATVEQAGGFTIYVARSPLGADEPRNLHPTTVVETKALSGVKAPDLEEAYRPSQWVMDAYKRGDISLDGQVDPVWAAIQQNDKYNMGMLVADDVGMGKSRTGAAFALDRIQRGRKRILVVTKDSKNVTNLMNSEFPQVAGGKFPAEMVLLSGETMPDVKRGTADIPVFNDRAAVYFTNIYQLPDFSKKIEILKPDVVIIDEVHNFKNIDDSKVRAETWNRLHKDWLRRDVSMLYLSATPGSDIADLQYLYGLKIWPMDGFSDWVGVITGAISPDQAKKVSGAKIALEEWGSKVQAAVDGLNLGDVVNKRVGYRDYAGIDLAPNLFAIETQFDNDWQLSVLGTNNSGGAYIDYGLIADQKNRVLLLGKILIEQNPGIDFTTTPEGVVRKLLYEAQQEFNKRYPVPNVDRDTIGRLGMADASDALDVQNRGKKKGWGAGRTAFESTITPEHTEQIMRELKVGGSYMSRDISRIGVEFEVKKVDVSPERLAQQNKRIDLYRRIYAAFKRFGKYNEGPKAHAAMFGITGDIQADAKRALFDLRLPQAMDEVDAALGRGEQVVLSVVSVGDADIDKGGNLASAMEKINTVKVKKEGKGDSATYSAPEDIPEALIEVADIKDELRQLGPLRSPIEILKEKYGDRVGFVTGNEDDKKRLKAMRDFQNNRLDVIVISKAGKEGINLHDITGQRRVHLIVADYEWSATNFKQELGRVDRTGQKSSPIITLLHTGNAGEVKFVSTIANRMKGLGATSKGGAESTGVGALNEEFELGSQADKLALSQTWANLSRAEKANFIDTWFNSQGVPGEKRREIPSTAESIKKFTLGLQSMKIDEANKILAQWMNNRAEMMTATAIDVEAKKMMSRGEILRKTSLGQNLELVEAKDQTGHRFGIITGVLTPHMNKLASNLVSQEQITTASWRDWINFKDAQTGEYASGLVIPPGRIERVAKDFGQAIALHRTPESAVMDLKAGDRIPIRGQDQAEWSLYIGQKGSFRENKIVVDGARMVHKDAVMRNGALYDARGNFFYVPEEKVPDFLKRFPLREAGGLAQSMNPGETYAFGPSGERYQFRYRVVPLDELVQSHLDTFDPNPRYPFSEDIQQRNRAATAYRTGVHNTARNLDERVLTETHELGTGTPIMGSDKVIESGNGRVMAMRRARMDYPERWQQYQDNLRTKLTDYGLSEGDLQGVKDPVLVRERLTEVDRAKFTREANESETTRLAVGETADADSRYIENSMLANLTIGEEQSIEGALRSPANRELVNSFLSKIPQSETTAFLAPDGSLSLDGLTRLRNAVFAAVYPGEAGKRLADAFLVSQSESVSNIRAAIFDTLAPMSQAESLIREGRRDADLSITDDIARAVDQYARLKQQGASISDYINQPGLLEKPTTPFQDRFLQYLDENSRSRKKLRQLLALYADNVINVQQDPAQGSLFGGAKSSKGEILDAVAEQVTGKVAGFEEVAPGRALPQPAMPERDMPPELATPIDTGPVAAGETTPEGASTPAEVPAVASPLGTAEQYHEPPVEEAAYEGWMKEVEPALRRAEAAMLDPKNRRSAVFDLDRDLDPATKKELRKYLGQVGADLTDAKLATIRYGEMKRDAALLNYSARTGMDNVLGTLMPYEFWMTRTMQNWALRALARPAILANWARLRNLQQQYMEGEGNIPTRLKKKVKIPTPFLPDWMGDSIYIDPLKQLFPFEQMMRPWEQLATDKNLETRKAESALDQMVQDEQITENQARQAKAARSGPVWQRAVAQARQDMDTQLDNPLDFAFMMSSPSLPISIAYNMLKGTPENIGQLPVTRLIQANTAALGLGGPRGINIEQPIRKAAHLPEIDKYEDYRVDRMLANLVAEGLVTLDDARRAMIDRTGPAYVQAQQRVSQMGISQYWGAPLGVDMFPEGERETRNLKTEYDTARNAWVKGSKTALSDFYEEHPEYQARASSFQEPGERLRRYLISEVWDKYMALPDLHRKQAREQLGKTFQDAFLDKETRSYDTINTATLATWAQMMGANNPKAAPEVPQVNLELAPAQTATAVQAYYDEADQKFPKHALVEQAMYLLPEGQRQGFEKQYPQLQAYYRWKDKYLADHSEIIPWVISKSNQLYGLPQDVQAYVYNYRARKEEMFPNVTALQDEYYSMSTSKRSKWLKSHPELSQYWTWRREVAAAYPQAAAYILSDATMQKAILGDEYVSQTPQVTAADLSMLTPATQRALLASVYSGEELRVGALEELETAWERAGKPYGSVEAWISAIKKVVKNGS